MRSKDSTATLLIGVCTAALCAGALALEAQQAAPGGRGGGRGGAATGIFTVADLNQDGFVTRDELKAAFAKWLSDGDAGRTGSLTPDQLAAALTAALPQAPPPAAAGRGAAVAEPDSQTGGRGEDAGRIAGQSAGQAEAASQGAGAGQGSRLCAFLHSAGREDGGCPGRQDRRLDDNRHIRFRRHQRGKSQAVRSDLPGQHYGGIFGRSERCRGTPKRARRRCSNSSGPARAWRGFTPPAIPTMKRHVQAAAAPFRPTPGGRGGAGATLASQMLIAGDTNGDRKLSREEFSALADVWFDKLDTEKAAKVSQQNFAARFASVLPPAPPAAPRSVPQGRDTQVGTWPEFDKMIGGFFKFHWVDPQLITVKIDDPKSPITAMFHGEEFEIHDETYTFGMDTWSRENLHILTSIDYDKMSDADKAKEDYPRADHDYGLSWIRREGKGRVFYEAHGHNERVYAIKPMLEHVLAGVQYALGDLKADDSPSVKLKK